MTGETPAAGTGCVSFTTNFVAVNSACRGRSVQERRGTRILAKIVLAASILSRPTPPPSRFPSINDGTAVLSQPVLRLAGVGVDELSHDSIPHQAFQVIIVYRGLPVVIVVRGGSLRLNPPPFTGSASRRASERRAMGALLFRERVLYSVVPACRCRRGRRRRAIERTGLAVPK